jgi:chloride channel 3/4/5
MTPFVLLGVLGGAMGALFIKATKFWAQTFRRIPILKKYPLLEVLLVALVTALVSFWNRYTKIPVTELLLELASPCDAYSDEAGTGLCPTKERIPEVILYLSIAFVIKAVLTTITFGIKLPAGIYVPSMVVGGLLGRIVGHITQYLALTYPDVGLFGSCDPNGAPDDCVTPGVYALVAAGACMSGVTR